MRAAVSSGARAFPAGLSHAVRSASIKMLDVNTLTASASYPTLPMSAEKVHFLCQMATMNLTVANGQREEI